MTLTLPDVPITRRMGEAQLRVELACGLYAIGKVTKVSGAELGGMDFFSFQKALGERRISTYTVDDLRDELQTLELLFPAPPSTGVPPLPPLLLGERR